MALSFSNLAPLNAALGNKTSSTTGSYLPGLSTLPSFGPTTIVPKATSALSVSAPKATTPLKTATAAPLAAKVIAPASTGSTTTGGASSPLVPLPYTPPSSTTTPTAPPQNTLYSGLIQALTDNAKAAAQASQISPEEQAARQKEADIEAGGANALANIGTHGWDAAFQQGQGGIVSRNVAAQEAAQQAKIQSYTAARGAALSGLTTSGTQLNSAATLAKPEVTAYGQTAFNPASGTFGAGGSAEVAQNDPLYPALQQYGHLLATGQQAAIPSFITSNPVLNAQVLKMAQTENPTFNINTAQGSAAAEQHNASVSGTATTDAYNSIYQKALGDYNDLNQAVQNVDGFGSILTSNMSSGGINPTDVKYANQTLSQIRAQLSSGAQAQYDSTLAALRSKISGMLSIGGNETPTAITADAQHILDGSLPLGSLNAVLERIQQEGNTLLQNQAQKVNTAKTGTQGGPGASGGGTQSDPLGIR